MKEKTKGMSLIVRTVSRLIAALILLFGIYIVLFGHLTPGGGFAGGLIIAGGIILLVLAYGFRATSKKLSYDTTKILDSFKILDSLGAFLLVAIALAAISLGFFFAPFWDVIGGTPAQWVSAGAIPYYNMAIGIKVTGALAAMFLGLVIARMMGEE